MAVVFKLCLQSPKAVCIKQTTKSVELKAKELKINIFLKFYYVLPSTSIMYTICVHFGVGD